MRTLIKGGTIVMEHQLFLGDVLIENEQITEISSKVLQKADNIINAHGKIVLPGGVDQHVHFDYTFANQTVQGFETSMAAIAGGTTTIAEFVNSVQKMDLLSSVDHYKKTKIADKACVDYVLHCNIKNPSQADYKDIATLPRIGISTLNIFMSDDTNQDYCKDSQILQILVEAKKAGLTTFVHGENCNIANWLTENLLAEDKNAAKYHSASRPILIEVESTERIGYLAEITQAAVMIVHISSKKALEIVKNKRQNGTKIYAETCPHYLVLDETYLDLPNFNGAKYVCNPPLRKITDQKALWQGLQNQNITCVGTDHCAFNWKSQKSINQPSFQNIPKGIPGLQERLSLLWTYGYCKKRISLNQLVKVFSTNPAKVLGIYPQKGTLAVGSDADIVIYEPTFEGIFRNLDNYHGIDYSAYEDMAKIGDVEMVLLRGNIVFANQKYVGMQGEGKFIFAKPFGYCYQ